METKKETTMLGCVIDVETFNTFKEKLKQDGYQYYSEWVREQIRRYIHGESQKWI